MLIQKFEQSLQSQKFVYPKDKVLIACSGGPDSVALTHLLTSLSKSWKFKLALVHLNHGLRGKDSVSDQKFVQKLAKELDIPFYTEKMSGLKGKARGQQASLEEVARKHRYDFFVRVAKEHCFKKVVLAHTVDDQAETVLMRLLQGTGPRGLSAIRSKRVMDKIQFSRPLLDFSKKELLDYLKQNKFQFCKDKSNNSVKFLRNRIRKQLLPVLAKEFNPRVSQALARLPQILNEENEMILELEEQAFKSVYHRKLRSKVWLHRDAFLALRAPLQFRVLNRVLKKVDARSGIDYDAWQRLREGLKKKSYCHSLPRDVDFSLSPSEIKVYKK